MKTSYLLIFLFICITVVSNCQDNYQPFSGGSGKYTKLVWHDEFDGNGLPDSQKWSYESGYIRNNELQFYTVERKENAKQEAGNLVITALNDSLHIDNHVCTITSASLNTRNKGDWKYGRVEVRAKLPASLGTWPAIWMMSTKSTFGKWPRSGEIDIMEHVGYEPDMIYFNLHTDKYNHTKKTGRGTGVAHPNAYSEFNVYAIEWFADRIDWYLNDVKVFTVVNDEKTWEAWPFDYEFYLIINFAFGGDWGASKGVDIGALPQHYYIDYVRVFQ